jgi:mRNA-degrading endonuclease HigB of HigAB toxin-antitoxin module
MRASQPNGFSDLAIDWISPELLIRRLVYAKDTYEFTRSENNNLEFYEKIVNKNFDNPEKILKYLEKTNKLYEKQILLFNHPEFLRA